MDGNLLRGNLELILLAILESGPKYGLEIIGEARSRTEGYFDFKEGSLYPRAAPAREGQIRQSRVRPV